MSDKPEYAFKGVWIPREIWTAEDITWMEKCLLAEINALDNGEGCYASNDHLAARFGSTPASVANQISKLRALGFLETTAFNGRRRWMRVKAALTERLTQDQPLNEGGVNPSVDTYIEVPVEDKRKAPSERGLAFADWFKTLLPDICVSASWRANWAKCYDDMLRLDKRSPEMVAAVCKWARADDFWRANFFTPMKLREKKNGVMYFDVFIEKMKACGALSQPKKTGPARAYQAHSHI